MLAVTHLRLSFFSLRAITTTTKLAETNKIIAIANCGIICVKNRPLGLVDCTDRILFVADCVGLVVGVKISVEVNCWEPIV